MAYIQFTFDNEASEGGFADGERVRVSLYDVVDGLSFLYKGRDNIVDRLELPCGKVKAVAGTGQGCPVFFISSPCVIETFFKVTVSLLMAGIAQMWGGV